jgi:molecular chaperone DnaK (HSP70)
MSNAERTSDSDTRHAPGAMTKYVVGIDLGTTNTVVAFADTQALAERGAGGDEGAARPQIQIFPVPQLVAAGEVAAHAQLPSFRYHPASDELPEADLALGFPEPMPELPRSVTGMLAQTLGSRVPGRLIASAKSWLCHPGVDRQAAILPWGAPEDAAKVSPVDASASYLAHLRAAWDAAHPSHPLHAQEVVLTVPASFDEAARMLTLEAARRAGLPRVRLLEEPQAAFYDWLDRHRGAALESALAAVRLVLVIDAGGGTTDLTLIRAELAPSGPKLTRIAVGDHLLLGGDNMDHTLARMCEPALAGAAQGRLPAARFAQLLQQCREAKQTLLSAHAPEQVSVTLLGAGSKVVAGRVTTVLLREQVERALVDGFFPKVTLDARPETRRSGLVEFGLPFVADPVITRHVAAFLARHRTEAAEALAIVPADAEREPARALPDAVLFNGGVFRSRAIETRMVDALADLRGAPLAQLHNPDPELAVARGAVAYGLARRGIGLKIGGGSPRSYYLRVRAEAREHDAVCVLPRGAEEGEEHAHTEGTFALQVGRPVRFALLASTAERGHRVGTLVRVDESYEPLPDLVAVIEGAAGGAELTVELHAQLTEVGTLEMSLVASEDPARRYRLEFQLRGDQRSDGPSAPARVSQLHPRFREATDLIALFYGKAQKALEGRKINTLRADLEKILGERERWDTPLLRELFGALLASSKRRRRSGDHERLWFQLAGYCLRPGFGYPVDAWRVDQVWTLYDEGVQFAPEAAVWAQFWILWRRIAGGLDEAQQGRILDDLSYYLDPNPKRGVAKPKGPRALGLEEMVRLAGSLERVPATRKVELGTMLIARVAARELSQAAAYWSLGRIGARAPWYGSAHTVVPPEIAGEWLQRLLALDLAATEQAGFAVAQLARFTHDRARDLAPELRERAAQALARLRGSDAWVQLVREGGELGASEATHVFGESLPPGLRLL